MEWAAAAFTKCVEGGNGPAHCTTAPPASAKAAGKKGRIEVECHCVLLRTSPMKFVFGLGIV